MRAPSPPDEPPAVREVWYGLQVLPYTGLAASIHMQSSETLVTASGIPPALRRAAAVGESSVALIPFLQSFKWNYIYWSNLARRPAVQERPVTGKQSWVWIEWGGSGSPWSRTGHQGMAACDISPSSCQGQAHPALGRWPLLLPTLQENVRQP